MGSGPASWASVENFWTGLGFLPWVNAGLDYSVDVWGISRSHGRPSASCPGLYDSPPQLCFLFCPSHKITAAGIKVFPLAREQRERLGCGNLARTPGEEAWSTGWAWSELWAEPLAAGGDFPSPAFEGSFGAWRE